MQESDPIRFLAQVVADYSATLAPSLRESLLSKADSAFRALIEERSQRAADKTNDGDQH